MIKVALFTDSDVFAGTERHMLDLALGLRAAGVDVRLACPLPSMLATRAAEEGLPVVAVQKQRLPDLTAIRTLADLLRTGAIDILHAHNGRTALLAAAAVTFAGKGRAVATQHFLEPAHMARSGLKALASKLMHWWVNRVMSHFIAISEAAKAGMLARSQASAKRISVVPHGMPTPDLTRLGAREAVRAELGISPTSTLIVCVARLEREKSLDTLVSAMRVVAAAEPSAVCVIAGDGAERGALLDQIAEGGLVGRVKLIGFRSDALAQINAGDVFVLPSAVESFGLVLIEAMSVERPVIAIRAGGPMEIVVEGETGVLVTAGAVDEMARAIATLVWDAESRRRLGTAGRTRFLERFTVERMSQATLQVYEKTLAA